MDSSGSGPGRYDPRQPRRPDQSPAQALGCPFLDPSGGRRQFHQQTVLLCLRQTGRIQQEGRQKRQEAETELRRIENDLKNKLLEMR